MEELPAVGLRHRFRSLALSLLVGLAAALLAWIFVQLGSEVVEGDTRSFDMVVLSAMQALRADHPSAAAVMRDLSELGSTVVLTLCAIITVGYLALVSARRMTDCFGGCSRWNGCRPMAAVLGVLPGSCRP